jgi:hypothetical protein
MVKMTGQERTNVPPDHFTWAGPYLKEKIGGFGLMPKTALVKYPIVSFIYKHLRARYCAECLML